MGLLLPAILAAMLLNLVIALVLLIPALAIAALGVYVTFRGLRQLAFGKLLMGPALLVIVWACVPVFLSMLNTVLGPSSDLMSIATFPYPSGSPYVKPFAYAEWLRTSEWWMIGAAATFVVGALFEVADRA